MLTLLLFIICCITVTFNERSRTAFGNLFSTIALDVFLIGIGVEQKIWHWIFG